MIKHLLTKYEARKILGKIFVYACGVKDKLWQNDFHTWYTHTQRVDDTCYCWKNFGRVSPYLVSIKNTLLEGFTYSILGAYDKAYQ